MASRFHAQQTCLVAPDAAAPDEAAVVLDCFPARVRTRLFPPSGWRAACGMLPSSTAAVAAARAEETFCNMGRTTRDSHQWALKVKAES